MLCVFFESQIPAYFAFCSPERSILPSGEKFLLSLCVCAIPQATPAVSVYEFLTVMRELFYKYAIRREAVAYYYLLAQQFLFNCRKTVI